MTSFETGRVRSAGRLERGTGAFAFAGGEADALPEASAPIPSEHGTLNLKPWGAKKTIGNWS